MVNKKFLEINPEYQRLSLIECEPYVLLIGVICGSLHQILPLLADIKQLGKIQYIQKIELFILANGESKCAIQQATQSINFSENMEHICIWESGGKLDSILPIGQARSVLQKKVGERMSDNDQSIAWIIDDDMRIPSIAHNYLSWLPTLRSKGADVVIGGFDGGSPNPAAHGLRVQLNDLWYNLNWLKKLNESEILPDRNEENRIFRYKYPDYYYDLSRKHSDHLGKPYWLVPEYEGETVFNARARLLNSLEKILTGEPFLRPLITDIPCNPLKLMKPSCNRGGNTFILNSKALTLTPNSVMLSNGKENRRSDMIWAIINRYYHQLNLFAVPFPMYHHRYIDVEAKVKCSTFDFDKTVGEVKGSAMYAALLCFFEGNKSIDWLFSNADTTEIINSYKTHVDERIKKYRENYQVIRALLDNIREDYAISNSEILKFISTVEPWVQKESLKKLENACFLQEDAEIKSFIFSLEKQILNFSIL